MPKDQLSEYPARCWGINKPLLPPCRQKWGHLSCSHHHNLLKLLSLCMEPWYRMTAQRSPSPMHLFLLLHRLSETSNSPTGDCQTFKWFIPVMAKALQSPAPAPQQLLAVWETSGHQRVLLGPSESQPGRPKAKINKGALHPLPSLLCAVTCVFLKRMACSPPHPHSWEGRSCKTGSGGKLREGLQGWVVCRGVHGQDLLPLCRGDVSYVCPCVCAQAHVCMRARILHAQNLCTQAHPSACANSLFKQVKNTALMSRGVAQAPECTSWFPVPKAAVVADYPSRFLWHPRF